MDYKEEKFSTQSDQTYEEVDSTSSDNNGIFVLNSCYKSNEQSNVSMKPYTHTNVMLKYERWVQSWLNTKYT